MTQIDRNEIMAESDRGTPTHTEIYRLVEYEDGSVQAVRGTEGSASRTVFDMSEVHTSNPAAAEKLLGFGGFEPNEYRCTFYDGKVDLDSGGYDYSIGFLPARKLKDESIDVDQIIGVTGLIPGRPPEAERTLSMLGIEKIKHMSPKQE